MNNHTSDYTGAETGHEVARGLSGSRMRQCVDHMVEATATLNSRSDASCGCGSLVLSWDTPLRKHNSKKTGVICWPRGPKNFLVLAFLLKNTTFHENMAKKTKPQEVPVFLMVSQDCMDTLRRLAYSHRRALRKQDF